MKQEFFSRRAFVAGRAGEGCCFRPPRQEMLLYLGLAPLSVACWIVAVWRFFASEPRPANFWLFLIVSPLCVGMYFFALTADARDFVDQWIRFTRGWEWAILPLCWVALVLASIAVLLEVVVAPLPQHTVTALSAFAAAVLFGLASYSYVMSMQTP